MARPRRDELFDALLDFGRVVGSSIASVASSVVLRLSGDGPMDGDEDEDDDDEAEVVDAEAWGSAALLHRPADPTEDGACEAVYARRGDERVAIATKDRRWQAEHTLETGEVVLRWCGDVGGEGEPSVRPFVHLKSNGDVVVSGRRLVMLAIDLRMTDESPSAAMALASKCNDRIDEIAQALDAYAAAAPVPNDGGAALQTALKVACGWGASPHPAANVGSTKVKAS
jgi:hypothetical protein